MNSSALLQPCVPGVGESPKESFPSSSHEIENGSTIQALPVPLLVPLFPALFVLLLVPLFVDAPLFAPLLVLVSLLVPLFPLLVPVPLLAPLFPLLLFTPLLVPVLLGSSQVPSLQTWPWKQSLVELQLSLLDPQLLNVMIEIAMGSKK